MSTDARTAQEQLTPEERRTMLRAFADRMLLKVSAMDNPEDLPGVEKAVRVAASIERIYSRCDRAERQTPDPRKVEAERANNQREAIKARVHLAGDLEWGEQRRQQLGKWWDAADTTIKPAPAPQPKPQQPGQPGPGNGLRTSVMANLDTALATYLAAPQNTSHAANLDIFVATECMVDAQAALEEGKISEADFDTIEDTVNDWLKSRPPPT